MVGFGKNRERKMVGFGGTEKEEWWGLEGEGKEEWWGLKEQSRFGMVEEGRAEGMDREQGWDVVGFILLRALG